MYFWIIELSFGRCGNCWCCCFFFGLCLIGGFYFLFLRLLCLCCLVMVWEYVNRFFFVYFCVFRVRVWGVLLELCVIICLCLFILRGGDGFILLLYNFWKFCGVKMFCCDERVEGGLCNYCFGCLEDKGLCCIVWWWDWLCLR